MVVSKGEGICTDAVGMVVSKGGGICTDEAGVVWCDKRGGVNFREY